eukprot:jgi/Mesvir1/27170/Mv25930-RA.1
MCRCWRKASVITVRDQFRSSCAPVFGTKSPPAAQCVAAAAATCSHVLLQLAPMSTTYLLAVQVASFFSSFFSIAMSGCLGNFLNATFAMSIFSLPTAYRHRSCLRYN